MNVFFNYFISRLPEIGKLLNQHLQISGIAVLVAIMIGVVYGNIKRQQKCNLKKQHLT